MTTKAYKPYNARRMPTSLVPKISYENCMARYLITPDAIIFKVRTCSTADFTRWIRAIILLIPDGSYRYVMHDLLKELDFASSVDRWYAINILLESKLAVPFYTTFDQAQAVLSQGK